MNIFAIPAAVFVALVFSVFFIGTNIEVFSAALGSLSLAVVVALWNGYRTGFTVPRTTLTVTLLLFWAWLAVTLFWSPVPFVSVTLFWWLSALPLAFWLYVLLPNRQQAWPWFAATALLLGVGLALAGIFQLLVLKLRSSAAFLDVNTQAALLMFIALPTGGYFLRLHAVERPDARKAMLLASLIFLLVYGLMITASRGGILAFFGGMGLLLWMVGRRIPTRVHFIFAGIVGLAFLLANLSPIDIGRGTLVERALSLTNPFDVNVGGGRIVIWKQSWRLLFEHSPVWGIGLGLYSLIWPPYRDPADGSGGYFTHNDYLQIWIEAGLPGLLLLLVFQASVFWMVWHAWRNSHITSAAHVEIAGLFAGFAAVSAHSFLQYNFYIIPILVLCGLLLGRIQDLSVTPGSDTPVWSLHPSKYFTQRGYRLIVAIGALLPIGYFSAIGLSSYFIARSSPLAWEGRIEEAERALVLAQRLWPDSDTPRFGRADLYRHVLLSAASPLSNEKRQTLFQGAETLLVEAEQRNPYRPHIFLVRGQLYELGPELAGAHWKSKTEQAYQRALQLEPRYYRARLNYARFLLGQGLEREARLILEDGMRYQYLSVADVLPYFGLTAQLRERAGDVPRARELRVKMGEILQSLSP